jgi:hypothetical protein
MLAHAKQVRPFLILTFFLTLILGLSLTGCEKTTKVTRIVEPELQTYVGSLACQACHPDIYAEFSKTGHNLILNPASLASRPGYYPYGDLPGPPPGQSWDDASYVIGGFWWKVRFIGRQGHVITGAQTQYNLETDRWVAYEAGTVQPYDCGPCHTTGYKYEGRQNGMEGIVGTWALNGIQCERCHGPGSKHVDAPYDFPMTINRSAAMCGECHIRGDVSKIPAENGFINDYEQYNEIHATKKINFACVDCHNPHISLHELNPTRASAIKVTCKTCHYEEAAAFASSSLPHYGLGSIDCIECHMAYAVKSAEGQLFRYEGDVRSHLFRINTSTSAPMFTSDGKYANGYLTLQYVCLRCHVSETVDWAVEHAPEVHPVSHIGTLVKHQQGVAGAF